MCDKTGNSDQQKGPLKSRMCVYPEYEKFPDVSWDRKYLKRGDPGQTNRDRRPWVPVNGIVNTRREILIEDICLRCCLQHTHLGFIYKGLIRVPSTSVL